jgi:hypothetical protein
LGGALSVVGTHTLYAYERMAGVHFASNHVATQDIDLLYDARDRLRILSAETRQEGLAGILRDVDASFRPLTPGGYRAVNDAGFIVDLILPAPRFPATGRPGRIGSSPDEMNAAEILGLSWLQNSPQLQQTVIDERGFPVRLDVPDPRAFALHKLWVSERQDRDRLKARRDSAQAKAVTRLVLRYLPQFPFDDEVLSALPLELRERIPNLVGQARSEDNPVRENW